jgi:hypothetical protein
VSYDLSYYTRRLREEREAAAAAPCERTRVLHDELAQLYAKMLRVLETAPQEGSPDTV